MQSPNSIATEVHTQTFDAEVLERSRETPVLVDFWAPWCGPCRALAPVLEKVVAESGGAVLLAKVNTDENPALAQRYQIRGIPAVKLFVDGKVQGEFTGAYPESGVRSFLREQLPSPVDEQVTLALHLCEAGDDVQAREILLKAMENEPSHAKGRLALAEIAYRAGDAPQLEQHARTIDPLSPQAERAEVLLQAMRLRQECTTAGGPAAARDRVQLDPADLDACYVLGCCQLGEGQLREALETFLLVVERNKKHRDEAARKAMLVIFGLVGHKSELADEFKRRLQIVL